MSNTINWMEWEGDYSVPWSMGSASIQSYNVPYDVVEELHKIVEEVTGKPVFTISRKIGFY